MRDDELRLALVKLAAICVIGAQASLVAAYPIAKKGYVDDMEEQLEYHTRVLTEALDGIAKVVE